MTKKIINLDEYRKARKPEFDLNATLERIKKSMKEINKMLRKEYDVTCMNCGHNWITQHNFKTCPDCGQVSDSHW